MSPNLPSPHGTDLILQDPPPYGPPSGVFRTFIAPADHPQLLAEQPLQPATAPRRSCIHTTDASLQLTPLTERSSPSAGHTAPSFAVAVLVPVSTPASSSPRRTGSHQSLAPRSPRPRSHTFGGPRRTRARDRLSPAAAMSAPSSSPPPYSLTPPDLPPSVSSVPPPRAASSPHLRVPGTSSLASHSHSRQAFSEYARAVPRGGPTSDDEDESGADTDEGVMFRPHGGSLADSLRNRLLGKGKGRAYDEHWSRPITTAPGAMCAGETETEGEDSVSGLPLSVLLSGRADMLLANLSARRAVLEQSPPSDHSLHVLLRYSLLWPSFPRSWGDVLISRLRDFQLVRSTPHFSCLHAVD